MIACAQCGTKVGLLHVKREFRCSRCSAVLRSNIGVAVLIGATLGTLTGVLTAGYLCPDGYTVACFVLVDLPVGATVLIGVTIGLLRIRSESEPTGE